MFIKFQFFFSQIYENEAKKNIQTCNCNLHLNEAIIIYDVCIYSNNKKRELFFIIENLWKRGSQNEREKFSLKRGPLSFLSTKQFYNKIKMYKHEKKKFE